MTSNTKPIIFFDGVCNLCNASVQFVIKRDKKKQFLFASLQSDVAKNILLHKKMKINLDSIVLLKGKQLFVKSDAALEILKDLGFPYCIIYVFKIIPKFIRDFVYDIIAKYRYQWFGKRATCMIPTNDLKKRFIE
ncbi:MAG TPA: thiol-disulfide oxidoreductase DCC family protein [Flavobacteriia bacterium]|nr:thiol-disulfide oxidoreductase DCC family protein [Flavobacteriia bacterium]